MNEHSFMTVARRKIVRKTPLPGSSKPEAILGAAARVFAAKGYHGSLIADVARAAGVAVGTVYLYFEGKEDLLVTLVRRSLEAYLEECRPLLATEAAGSARLRRLMQLHLVFYERDPVLAKVLQVHLREVEPSIREGIRPALRAVFDGMEEVLRSGIAAGDFDRGLDVKLARKFLFGGLDAVVTSWVLRESGRPLRALLDPLHQMAARSFGAANGDAADSSEIASGGNGRRARRGR